jgi:hypothetical protein
MIAPWLTVLTTPARTEYLLDTLASILEGGGHRFVGSRIVFVDGDPNAVPAVPRGWTKLTTGAGPRGNRRAMWKILNLAAIARVPYLLYFEDDVRLCRNAIAAMSAIAVPPGVAFLTFLQQQWVPAERGIHCRRADDPKIGHGYWGNQALKIPLRSLRTFERRHTEPINQWLYASDVWLGEQLASRGSAEHHYGIVQPALVRHVGVRTTIPGQEGQTIDGHRAGLNYAGDDFDAARLPANLPLFDLFDL